MKMVSVLTGGLVFAFLSITAEAHPGRTASDGCHYCRTNCSYWGVAQGQRHCHGSGLHETPKLGELVKSSYPVQDDHDSYPHSHSHEEESHNVNEVEQSH